MANARRTSCLIWCCRGSSGPARGLEQAGPGRLPCEQFPGNGGGGGAVQADEVAQESKVLDSIDGVTDAVGMPR